MALSMNTEGRRLLLFLESLLTRVEEVSLTETDLHNSELQKSPLYHSSSLKFIARLSALCSPHH